LPLTDEIVCDKPISFLYLPLAPFEAVKKLKYSPSPYPLPRGEGVNTLNFKRNFPPPRWGRARVGVEMGFFHTFPFKGEGVKNLGEWQKKFLT
jgi:hypothetical protein